MSVQGHDGVYPGLNHPSWLKPGGSLCENRHSWGLYGALVSFLRKDYSIPVLSYRITHHIFGGADFFGRPAPTWAARIAAEGRGPRAPSLPQERFRTWPRLLSLGDPEGIIYDKAGQIGTKQVALRRHATIADVDALREPFFVLLPTDTHLG